MLFNISCKEILNTIISLCPYTQKWLVLVTDITKFIVKLLNYVSFAKRKGNVVCVLFCSQMVGVEYILLHAQEPILYIIRKQQRQSPTQGEQCTG